MLPLRCESHTICQSYLQHSSSSTSAGMFALPLERDGGPGDTPARGARTPRVRYSRRRAHGDAHVL